MKILYYSHGADEPEHIQQTLAIAAQVALDFPQATQLLVTGTPQPRRTKLPCKLDFIKLPCLAKTRKSGFHDPSLLLPSGVIKTLREAIILNAIKHFEPDVVFINKAFDGSGDEFRTSLTYLRHERPATKLAIGMNNINDDALMVRNTFLAAKAEQLRYRTTSSEAGERHSRHYQSTPSSSDYPQVSTAAA